MIDSGAMALKEWRELLGQKGIGGKLGIVLFIAMFGIVLPLQNGPQWISSPMLAITWSWAPMFLVMTVIADAFAGERERHTLETLLASRLSDRAILFGKIGAAIGYAVAVTAACLLAGVLALNLVQSSGGFLFYALPTLASICAFGVLGALLVASVGVVVSLRSSTVRQAQQTLSGVIIVLLLVPIVLVRVLPAEWRQALASTTMSAAELAIIGMATLALLDALIVLFTLRTFRRARLIAT